MVHTVALSFLLHPSLSFLCLVFFSPLVPVTAGDGGGRLQGKHAANHELQVRQTCKQALITPLRRSEVTAARKGGTQPTFASIQGHVTTSAGR